MAEKNYAKLKLQAEEMYVDKGYTLTYIAEVLHLSPNTLTKWKNDGDWDSMRNYAQNAPHRVKLKLNKLMEQIVDGKDEHGNELTIDQIKTRVAKADAVSKIKPALALLEKEISPSVVDSVIVMLDNWTAQNYPSEAVKNLDLHRSFLSHIVSKYG